MTLSVCKLEKVADGTVMKWLRYIWLWMVFTGMAVASSEVVEVEGITFPPSVTLSDGTVVNRTGAGLLRVGWIFKVYASAYYTESGTDAEASVTADIAKRLEIHYLRDFDAEDIVKAGNNALGDTLTDEELAAIRADVDTINEAYVDIRKGDVYTLTYVPGIGTTLELNGDEVVTIPGEAFGRQYFRIWLDPAMPYPDFRNQLLGL